MGTRIGAWLVVAVLSLPCAARATPRLLFFDPDANQDRLLTIVELFTTYLEEQHVDLTFEPVQTLESFTERAASGDVKFAIVTSNYLQKAQRVHVEPLLVPELDGTVYYQKQLVALGKGASTDFHGKTIAATVPDTEARATLNALKGLGINVAGAFVVSVSKDVDALLALSFGQADGALVTTESIRVLQDINPSAAEMLQVSTKLGKTLRSPLVEVGHHATQDERAQMIKLINGLANDARGKQLANVLSLHRWVKYHPEMLQ